MKMKKTKQKTVAMILAVVLMVGAVFTGALLPQTASNVSAKSSVNEKIVVLYFSGTGTTKGFAKRIQKATNGKLIAIKAKEAYTDDDLDYSDAKSRVTVEHNSAGSPAESTVRPAISNLKAIKKAVKNADTVYIGYPIWWGEAPHILYTLVEKVSLKNKTVVPFCTSASSGIGDSAKNLKNKAKINDKTNWLSGKNYYDIPSQKTVNKWVKSLGL